ncbi:MAG TPA: hypothetical protein PK900_11605, partial [Spirochaetota bacterium]|nr:hypothetical protein [Spirochaetota bacterium]
RKLLNNIPYKVNGNLGRIIALTNFLTKSMKLKFFINALKAALKLKKLNFNLLGKFLRELIKSQYRS